MQNNIAAVTRTGGMFPDYVTVNREADGKVSIAVREAEPTPPGCSPRMKFAKINLSPEEWAGFAKQIGAAG